MAIVPVVASPTLGGFKPNTNCLSNRYSNSTTNNITYNNYTPGPTASPVPAATPTPTPSPLTLNGAGATFPQQFLNAVINAYSSSRPWATINYQGVGSGTEINSLTSKTVDFAASDAPLSDSQRQAAPNAVHIPETIGAVTLAYNLPGIRFRLLFCHVSPLTRYFLNT